MPSNITVKNGREKVIYILKDMFSDSELDFDRIQNTRLWDLEAQIGVDHFSFVDSIGRRSGHIPLHKISKKEIESSIYP